MTKKSYKKLKEKEFKQIKALLNAGISISKVSQYSGRSTSTIGYIAKSNIFEEYRKKVNEINRLSKERRTPTKAEAVDYHSTNGTLPQMLVTLQEINGTLQKLEKLWEDKPRRRSWL